MSIQGIKEIGPAPVNVPEATVSFGKKRAPVEKDGLLKDAPEARKDLVPREIDEIASDMQIQLKRLNTELRLEVDRQSHRVIVKIVDQETEQVIRQIPSEELLAISRRMEELIGVLYKAES